MGRGDWIGVFSGRDTSRNVGWGYAAHFPKLLPYWDSSIFFLHPPPPPPPLWKATSHAGPFRIFFQRSRQNSELQRFRQQKSWVSESLPPSPNVENLWNVVPFMTKICVFYCHIYVVVCLFFWFIFFKPV